MELEQVEPPAGPATKIVPHKLELKAFKCAQFASEETLCFEANLYVDGKKICRVNNDGHGGSNSWWFPKEQRDLEKEIEEYLKSLPADLSFTPGIAKGGGEPFTMAWDLEHAITHMAHQADQQNWWKRTLRNKTYLQWTNQEYEPGNWTYYQEGWGTRLRVFLDLKQAQKKQACLIKSIAMCATDDEDQILMKWLKADPATRRITAVRRRSWLPFDIEWEGYSDDTKCTIWMPLGMIRDADWTSARFAELTHAYGGMVLNGDWRGIRDSEPAEIWEMFRLLRKDWQI